MQGTPPSATRRSFLKTTGVLGAVGMYGQQASGATGSSSASLATTTATSEEPHARACVLGSDRAILGGDMIVGRDGYDTIQSAWNDAHDGDTVYVHSSYAAEASGEAFPIVLDYSEKEVMVSGGHPSGSVVDARHASEDVSAVLGGCSFVADQAVPLDRESVDAEDGQFSNRMGQPGGTSPAPTETATGTTSPSPTSTASPTRTASPERTDTQVSPDGWGDHATPEPTGESRTPTETARPAPETDATYGGAGVGAVAGAVAGTVAGVPVEATAGAQLLVAAAVAPVAGARPSPPRRPRPDRRRPRQRPRRRHRKARRHRRPGLRSRR
jgi:hypothetical protein